MGKHIFIITGPTASGKSDVGLHIAYNIRGSEIISADSMQVYRNMDIGTAKVPFEIRKNIPHHLIDIVDPWESYSLGMYVRDAQSIISKIENNDKLLLVVGGTGLYIKGLTHGVFNGPEADWKFRNKFISIAQENGSEYIYNLLKKIDPDSANKLHPKDHKRIIRALEVYEKTGTPISVLQKEYLKQKPSFTYSIFVINRSKEDLYKRIDSRTEKMFEYGLIDEVKALQKNQKGFSKQAQQALGYKETLRYLNNEISFQDTKDLIKQNTKKFVKRQITWFRSLPNTSWVNALSENNTDTVEKNILKMVVRIKT